MENNELLDKILKLQADNKIAFMTMDGLHSIDIADFDNQPLEGKLYDLNRDRGTLYSMANEGKNKRWINDLAMVYFIEYWGECIEKQRQEIVNLKSENNLLNKKIDAVTKANEELVGNNTTLNLYITELEDYIAKNEIKENNITTELNNIEKHEPINANINQTRRMGDEHVQNISFQL